MPLLGDVPFGGLRRSQVTSILSVPMSTRAARGTTETRAAERGVPRRERIGERLRQLRVAAGLTQTDLAGDRFSKEYISQIERGKTRPTSETIEWLAGRLGVDPGFLQSGLSTAERGRSEAALARAEAAGERHRYEDAV